MDPIDQIYGAEPRRYLRLVCEFEVEVTDPTQAATYTMDWGRDEAGKLGMMPHTNQNQQMAAAVGQVLAKALHDAGPQAGFRWMGGSPLPRQLAEDGRYREMTLPSLPARRDDGTFDE
jgi:hypothetical protein